MTIRSIIASCPKLAILPVIALLLCLSSCAPEEDLSSEVRADSSYDFSGPQQTYYVAVSLDMPGGMPSRAYGSSSDASYAEPDFQDGTLEDESKISNMLLVLYNKNGEYITHLETDKLEVHNPEDDVEEDGDAEEDGSGEKDNGDAGNGDADPDDEELETDAFEDVKWRTVYTVPIKVYESINIEDITYYFVVVNYDAALLVALKKSDNPVRLLNLNEMEPSLVGSLASGDKGFLMTTAAHYDKYGKFQWYDKRPEDNAMIYRTKAESKRHPVNVTVERVASRMDVAVNTSGIETVEVVHGRNIYELTFNPQYWDVEAQERSSYLVKHQNVYEEAHGQNAFPADFEYWVNYNGLRTFWAESPSFMDCRYPSKGINTELSNTAVKLGYKTFEEFSNGFGDTYVDHVIYKTGYGYFFEHTFNFTELTAGTTKNPYAVPSSLVVLGQYSAKYTGNDIAPGNGYEHPDPDEETEAEEGIENYADASTPVLPDFTKKGSGFYIRNINFERDNTTQGDLGNTTTKEENGTKIPVYDNLTYRMYIKSSDTKDELLDSLIREQNVVFRFDKETKKYLPIKKGKSTPDLSEIFKVANTNTRFFNGEWTDAANTYTLQLKDNFADIWNANHKEKSGELYYGVYDYDKKEGVYTKLTDDSGNRIIENLEKANRQLQIQLGYSTYYDQGKGFFYTPIPHYSGDYDPYYDNSTGKYAYSGLFNYTTGTDSDGNKTYTPEHKTAHFGMVRNHLYNINVSGISKLGYGKPEGDGRIPLPDPVFDDRIYQFNINLEVLPWYIVNYPHINIGGSNN